MSKISGFPYFEVQFTKSGKVHDDAEAAKFLDGIKSAPPTDLLVMSHGWNNDMEDARGLYRKYFAEVRKLIDADAVQLGGRSLTILGVLWPSKKFAEDDLIPGGGANLQGDLDGVLRHQLDVLEEIAEDDAVKQSLRNAKTQISRLEDQSQARRVLVQAAKAVIEAERAPEAEDDGVEDILAADDLELMKQLEAPAALFPLPTPGGGAANVGAGMMQPSAGGAAGLGDFLSGMKAAANRLLNYTTYYAMKERAGEVGKKGLAPLLAQAIARVPALKIHLIGHSFGGRLVTSAASALPDGPGAHLRTLLLLQAAFSHHGFSGKFGQNQTGFFRKVVAGKKVNGPIIVTHTANDRAVGLAYALASRIARDDASAVGDADDRFGGIGRNGAQKTTEALNGKRLRNEPFTFNTGSIHNLLADDEIGDHSDVCRPATARVLLESIKSEA